MIYYEIQDFGVPHNLEPLLALLDYRANHIHVSLDSPKHIVREVQGKQREMRAENVCIAQSEPITWAGSSITQRMFDALEQSLSVPKWEYFINLSGTCIPLKPQHRIIKRLTREYALQGKRNFCYSFEAKRAKEWLLSTEADEAVEAIKYARVFIKTRKSIAEKFRNGSFDPARNVVQRVAGSFTESTEKNHFILEPLSRDEISYREAFFKDYPLKFGRQWVILHRSTVEWLVTSDFARKMLEFSKRCFVSDEMFFQMALVDPRNPYVGELALTNLRFEEGSPLKITDENFAKMRRSGTLFARKVMPSSLHLYARLQASFARVSKA